MRLPSLRIAALVGLAIAFPHAAPAQQRTPPADAARAAAEVQAWFGELEQLQTRIESIQQRALADPQLSAAQSELGERIKLAMEKADPTLGRSLTRMEAMETEAAAAQQKGDTTRLQQLGAEAQQIQRQFMAAQERVLQQPEIAGQVAAFQEKLQKKMIEVSPDVETLIDRFREIEAKLASAAPAGGH